MSIEDRVVRQSAIWIGLAQAGKISYQTASLLINTFELGMAEFAEEVELQIVHKKAYQKTQDVNLYIQNQGEMTQYPPCVCNDNLQNEIASTISRTCNFKSRLLHKKLQKINVKHD